MTNLRSYLLALLTFWSLNCDATQTLASPKEVRAMTDMVMSKVASGDLDFATSEVKKYSIVPDAEVDASFGQFKIQQSAIAQRFGASIGTEFVSEEKVGSSLLRLTYLHRFERHPMKWVFDFYRGNDGWVLDTFQSNDNLASLFR